MEQPDRANFNLDSFIRKRADEQRQQQGSPSNKPTPTSAPTKQVPPCADDPTPDVPPATARQPEPTPARPAAVEAALQQQSSSATTEQLSQSSQEAVESQQLAEEAVTTLQSDAEGSQARLAAEAAQEAAQASLDAMEFAHQAARSAIEEASEGRKQKESYSTHRLLVILNITLLISALVALYLFIQQPASPPPATPVATVDTTTEHLTQQLLLDTQRERLRSEQELALMEQSLARLVEEQKALRKVLDQATSQLQSERARNDENQQLAKTFTKMEQDLKQQISALEQRLETQPQPSVAIRELPAPTVAPTSKQQTAITTPPAAQPVQPATNGAREQEVDALLQKLYNLHSELSEQKEASEPRPYSYNRR